jgi:hypothetical protein
MLALEDRRHVLPDLIDLVSCLSRIEQTTIRRPVHGQDRHTVSCPPIERNTAACHSVQKWSECEHQ